MSNKAPDRTSMRTHERATALAWMRGCDQDNGCWNDCYEAALDAVVDDRLDEAERGWATTSTYFQLTHSTRTPNVVVITRPNTPPAVVTIARD